MTIFVVSVAVALCVSFFCSLMEAALLSLTPSQIANLSARHPGIGAIWRRVQNQYRTAYRGDPDSEYGRTHDRRIGGRLAV